MICEKCKGKMNWSIEGATQGWRCPMCARKEFREVVRVGAEAAWLVCTTGKGK